MKHFLVTVVTKNIRLDSMLKYQTSTRNTCHVVVNLITTLKQLSGNITILPWKVHIWRSSQQCWYNFIKPTLWGGCKFDVVISTLYWCCLYNIDDLSNIKHESRLKVLHKLYYSQRNISTTLVEAVFKPALTGVTEILRCE